MIFSTYIFIAFFQAVVIATPLWLQQQAQQEANHVKKMKLSLQDSSEKYFTQKLDHFNREVNQTFQQRYFVNTTLWKNTDEVKGPVFLCVGGEGPPLDASVLISSVHCNDMVELASEVGALLLALEHRYYGNSNPFGNSYATTNLQWLNTEQALGDIATFIQYISKVYNLTPSNKWVTWGGSYPGMVAGLARLRYPHLIHAAVASSAPLQPVVNMVGYNNVVAASISNPDVGGSQECLSTVKEGHRSIGTLLQTDAGRKQLQSQFNICRAGTLDDIKNQEQFAGDGVIYLPVQSNDPSCTSAYCNIASICAFLTDKTSGEDPLQRLAALSRIQSGGCVSANYDAMIKFYAAPNNPERSWLYQTCTEWGFYQTCETTSNCPYTQGLHTLEVDYDICYQAFGISSDAVNTEIANTLEIYGGDQIQGSRIIYTNGEIDPWQANSVLVSPAPQSEKGKSSTQEQPVVWVKGASHHFWTHPSLPTDSIEVNEARKIIWNQVTSWLKE